MSTRRLFFFLLVAVAFLIVTGIPTNSLNSGENGNEEITLISGRNVNMVSGITLPGGDPYLQRQNEPSIAVSTRNPLHLIAGANDYRTVDMLIEGEELPGQEEKKAAGDAWLGVFKSFDGGQSWTSTLLPGFPQDSSPEGEASPLKYKPFEGKGFRAAADPVVRAGTNGLFYYCGIAFNRDTQEGVVFVSRFIDNNNTEEFDCIKYLDTKIIAKADPGKKFLDKPWIAVDVPRGKLSRVRIDGQDIPRSDVYIVYSEFEGSGDTLKSKIIFRKSKDCGAKWEKPKGLSKGHHLNQGATIAVAPTTRGKGKVYVAWRRFYKEKKDIQNDAIIIAWSTDGGRRFHKAIVAEIPPFDQPSTEISFRTNSYPTMAVDDTGRIYLAWAQRYVQPTGAARIVLTTSMNGKDWTIPEPIDNPIDISSHQFMPTLTFSAGKLMLAWYDQRLDFSGWEYGWPDMIQDSTDIRHTVDVWAAQADTSDYPYLNWTSTQVSRYLFNLMLDANGDIIEDDNGDPVYIQMQFNPPNYPLFKGGTWPFLGDYVDVSPSPMFVVGEDGKWRFNTEPMDNPVFHITWTDNRDVRPPIEPPFDWTNYSPPTSDQLDEYESDNRPPCPGGQGPGMRNQNIYTSRLSWGIEAGALVNSKPLDLDVPRSFVIFVRNNTVLIKIFRLTIANQPPGGQASFLQFEFLESLDVKTAPYSTMTRPIFIDSSDENASVRIAIEEIDEEGNVVQDGLTSYVIINPDPDNPGITGGGVESEETHNPNIVNPNIVNWYVNPNIVNPNIVNPNIVNPNIVNPNIVNPNIVNPNIVNPNIVNPNIVNPNIVNPNIVNPNIVNPNIVNPNIVNPNIVNPNIVNPNIVNANPADPEAVRVKSVTDVGWTVINEGNTATSYTLKALAKESLPKGFYAQLLVYKVTYVPAAAGSSLYNAAGMEECELKETPQHQLLLNIVNPNIVNPNIVNPNIVNPNIVNASIENATFSVAPGEEVLVTLRIFEIEPSTASASVQSKIFAQQSQQSQQSILDDFIDSLGFAVTSHSVNSEEAEQEITTPPAASTILLIGTSSLPDGVQDQYYDATLSAYGGKPPYSWAANSEKLPPGLDISTNPDGTGIIFGTPTTTGTYTFIVEVTDTESQTDTQLYSITIHTGTVPESPTITTTSLPSGVQGKWYGAALEATGGNWPLTWSWSAGSTSLPDGLTLDPGGVISGTPTTTGTYNFDVTVTDKDGDSDTKNRDLEILASTGEYFTISGTVTFGVGSSPLQGVLIHGLPGTPTTDVSGFYTDTVPEGWSGTATPFMSGFSFDLPETSYTNVTGHITTDYTATPLELDHFDIGMDSPLQTAGTPFTITIIAKDSNDDIVESYSEINTLSLSDPNGTISPTSTGAFENGVWTGDVTITTAHTGVEIITSGYGKTGVSIEFNVTAGALDHFDFDHIDDQIVGTPFSITITAKDSVGNIVTTYAVINTLSDTTETISPTSTGAFTNGSWTGNVTISAAQTGVTINTFGSGKNGVSNAFNITAAAASKILVETAADGSGTVVPVQNVASGSSITVYAISRDAADNFVENVVADTWELVNETGGVDENTDLNDVQSYAVFTGHLVGSAQIHATSGGLAPIDSGTITVIAGALDHFDFDTISSPQIAGAPFSIIITAKDAGGNTVSTHTGPNNLSLSQTGTIIPSTTGTFTNGVWTGDVKITTTHTGVQIQTTYDPKAGTSNSFNVSAPPPAPTITTTSVPDGVKDTEYSTTIEATGGIEPLNWSILTGSLPYDLDIDPDTGVISGTPTESGNFNFTVQVEDSLARTDTQDLSMTVAGWIVTFNHPVGDEDDLAYDIAVDSSGNVYVTGITSLGGGNGDDFYTVKYNTDGGKVWDAEYHGGYGFDHAKAVAVDSEGNVYVTGKSYGGFLANSDYAIVKYNSAGVQQWIARYDNGADEACAIAVDSSGNVYVTGKSGGSGTGSDYATIKYDSSGNQLWVARYNDDTSNADDEAYAIAVDSSGNVYVTGRSDPVGFRFDYVTIKYDSSGNQLWAARYEGPGNGPDEGRAIAVDSSGNVYVTGESFTDSTVFDDYATVKYDSSGNELWAKRYNGPGNDSDQANAIAVDTSGNVYVTGYRSAISGVIDYATIKYDSSGTELWVAPYDGPGNSTDNATDIAIDPTGNVYVSGYSEGDGSDNDYATVKYDSSGNELWIARYNGPGNFTDRSNAIALDPLGNVYVTGYSYRDAGLNRDMATIKYTQSFPSTLTITTETLDNGYAGLSYAATVWAFGGVDNRTWSIIGGALPSDLSLDSNTGVISGTPSADGTFNFTVQVTDGNLAVDKALSITVLPAPVPTSLAFTQQPSGGSAGDSWTTQPVVVIKDQYGSTVTSDNTTEITLAIDNNPGDGTLSGNTTVTVVNGAATFTDLSIDKASTYYNLEATSDPSYDPAYSEFFDITAGSASKLGFIQDPEGCTAEEVWTQQPKVAVQDQYGNTVTSDNSTQISVVISSNPGSGTLSGTQPITVSAGVATFTNLSINNVGIGYNLEATSDPSYTHAFCEPFDVNAKITGTVMFNELAVTNETSAAASFRVQYVSSRQELSGYTTEYNTTTGSYTVYNVPPGSQYYISIRIDTSIPPDSNLYPGEFHGYSSAIDVPIGQAVVNQDLNVEEIMHLISPIDNNIAQQWPGPVYDEYPSPVLFDWDALIEAANYQVKVYKSDGSVVTVVDTPGITETQASIPLPVSAVNEHYVFELWAFNGNGIRVGRFMIVYTSGHGWDYRFRVTAPPAFPEINIKQDTTDIADGGGYDFGSHAIGSNTDVIFTIENLGTADLTITTPITITGTNSDQFSVQAQPTSPVAQAGSTTFTIRFSPTSEGVKYASIAVGNNDADENPYDISLNGTGNQFTKMTSGAIVEDVESSRGSAWGDYDNDGDLDLFVSNMEDNNNSLYTNNGDGSFTKVASGEVVTDGGISAGCAWGDYDNDGDLDLFVSNMGNQDNSLYTNNGNGTFTKVTSGAVVTDGGFSIGSAWGDYDNDGDLDLFVSNGDGQNNFLYTNNGDGTFTKVASGAIVEDGGSSVSSAWGDYDNDGDLDLFVSNSGNPPDNFNFLYTNNGDGTFTKVASGTVVTDEGWSEGCAWGDYDNDGDLDLFVSNYGPSNSLYTNNGNGSFTKVTSGAVVTDGGASMGCAWGDYDNDGDLDLFVSNGGNQNNFLYTNNGDGSFTKVTSGAVVADGGFYGGCPWGDYDNDGDLDLFVSNWGPNNFLYTNNGGSNNWLNIECHGVASNVSAIGAKVKVLATIKGNPVWQLREISGGTLSQDSLNAEFGLGDATLVDEIRVEWPSGNVQSLEGESVNQFLTVTETETYEFVTKWGSQGDGEGEFHVPNGIAVDSSSNVYVMDTGNHRVQKFTSSGSFVTKWGSYGFGDDQFNGPSAIAVDSSGNVYVMDAGNNRVQKFTSSGTFVTEWGNQGDGEGEFNYPRGIAVDSSGNVYVADFQNHRIQKFDSIGTFLAKWGNQGDGDGQFNFPAGIAVDSSGYVYVTNTGNHRVQKFTSSGTFVAKWGGLGTGDGKFNGPSAIAVDSSGYVYVTDTGNHRVQKFTSSGTFVTKWGNQGDGEGQFDGPRGIAVDSSSYVYVTDTGNHRVQKFQKQ